jgi:hypothetical protein
MSAKQVEGSVYVVELDGEVATIWTRLKRAETYAQDLMNNIDTPDQWTTVLHTEPGSPIRTYRRKAEKDAVISIRRYVVDSVDAR